MALLQCEARAHDRPAGQRKYHGGLRTRADLVVTRGFERAIGRRQLDWLPLRVRQQSQLGARSGDIGRLAVLADMDLDPGRVGYNFKCQVIDLEDHPTMPWLVIVNMPIFAIGDGTASERQSAYGQNKVQLHALDCKTHLPTRSQRPDYKSVISRHAGEIETIRQ